MSYKLKSVVAFFKFLQTKYISPHQKEKKMAWAMPIQGLEKKKKYEKKPNTRFMTSQRV